VSTRWTLPAWHAVADLNERDALQDFIYHESPAGADEVAWREHLKAAIMVAHEELCARQARMSDHRSSPADPSATSLMQPRLSGAEVAGDRQAFIGDPPHCPNCGCEEGDTDGC